MWREAFATNTRGYQKLHRLLIAEVRTEQTKVLRLLVEGTTAWLLLLAMKPSI